MMILYQTDRGQCIWSDVVRQSGTTYFGDGVFFGKPCTIVRKALFVGGKMMVELDLSVEFYPTVTFQLFITVQR